MKKKELVERRAEILAEMQNLVDVEEPTDENNEQFEKLDAELKTIDIQFDRISRLDQAKELGNQSVGRISTPASVEDKVEIVQEEAFQSPGHFLQAVRMAADRETANPDTMARLNRHQSEIMAATGLSEGVPSDGGFLVSTEMVNQIRSRMFSTGKLQARCSNNPIGPGFNALSYPMLDESSRVNGSRRGGLLSYWSGEAATMTASQTKWKEGRMVLDKLTVLTYATDELLSDVVALQSWYERNVPQEFGFKMDDAIVNGTGAGMPLGILNNGSLITVAKESSQAAATVVAQNIMKMYSRHIDPANAIWLISQDVWPQIFQMSLAVGTGGAPLFVPPGGLSAAPYGTLFGRPIIPIEQCSTLGTVGDIILADLSAYLIIDKGGVNSASSIHVKFSTNETAFRWTYRVNGQPFDSSAVTPYNGGDTISEFVTLATR